MKRFLIGCCVAALLVAPAAAGVVVQMEASGSGSEGDMETLYAQGEMVRMDQKGPRRGKEMTMIFRDQTMWFLDHDKKVAQMIDKEGIAALSEQLNAVMKQMESMPAEQRAMMEKMMKGRMPGQPAERRLETGGSDKVAGYDCTVHTLYAGDLMRWEACTAPEGSVPEMAEAMPAFKAMAEFAQEMQKAVQQGPLAAMVDNPFNDLDELKGFPVRSRVYDRDGKLLHETTLKSVEKKNVEASMFEIPKDYEVKDMKEQMARGMGKRGR